MIDLSRIVVLNGNPQVFSLPVTASLDRIGLVPGTMTIASSGAEQWPPVSIEGKPGPEDDQAATLWVLLPFGGAWYAAGAERLRPSQVNGTKPEAQPQYGGLETLIGDGWFGKHDPPLRGARLTVGQLVGFMLVPGSTRFDTQITAHGRSNILIVKWPDANGANPLETVWREGQAPPVVVPPVVPPPTQEPAGTSEAYITLAADVSAIKARLTEIEATAAALVAAEGRTDPGMLQTIGDLATRVAVVEDRQTDLLRRMSEQEQRIAALLDSVRRAGGWLSTIFRR